jgi:ribosomal protein S18 acetylase RimI-like enzyme
MENLAMKLEKGNDVNALKERVLENLENRGILRYENGHMIFDVEELKKIGGKKNPLLLKVNQKQVRISKEDIIAILKDKKGISSDDYEKYIEEGIEISDKPIFVVPESNEDAYRNFGNKDAYLYPWELYGEQKYWDIDYAAKNGEKIDLAAWAVAQQMHDKFDLQRDKEGNASIVVAGNERRQPLAWETMRKNGLIGQRAHEDGRGTRSVHRFLDEHPDLIKYEILRENDFRVINETAYEFSRKRKKLSEKSVNYSTDGVSYYIGREAFVYTDLEENRRERIPKRDMEIVALDQHTVGIVRHSSGKEELCYVFSLLAENEKEKKRKSLLEKRPELSQNKSALAAQTVVGNEDMMERVIHWRITDDNPQWPNESATEYAERIRKISGFQYIDETGKNFSIESNVNIHNLSWREQQWLVTFRYQYETRDDIEKLYLFGKQFGLEGLKAFLNCEYDMKSGERIITLGEKLDERDAKKVFDKINGILEQIEGYGDEIKNIIGKETDSVKIKLQLFKKTTLIIKNFSDALQEKNNVESIEKLLSDLEKSKTEIILLAAALKSGVALEQLKDWEVSEKEDLDEAEKEEMVAITERNWDQIKNIKGAVVGKFKETLGNEKKKKWYVAKFQNKVVSFMMFTLTDRGTLYAGSFNVDPDARGLGIGDEMMERALRKESETHVLEATVSPRIPAGTAYVERTGFVIDGYIANYHETGEPLFAIRLDNQQNEVYKYRNEGKSEPIDEEHLKNQCWTSKDIMPLIGQESFVLKFDMKDQDDFARMENSMKILLMAKDDEGKIVEGRNTKDKYVITRYFRDKKEKSSPAGEDARYFVFEKIA